MKSEIVLADGNKRVIVIEAIRMVIDAMESDHEAGVVEIFVEVSKDADGNVSPVAEGKIECIHKDGKMRAMEEGETNFLMFCKSEGVMPRDPANPWKNDYSGTTWQNHIYRISVAELGLFAARYGVVVAVTEDPPAPEQANSETEEGSAGTDRSALMARRKQLNDDNCKKITATLAKEFHISDRRVRAIVSEEKGKPRSGMGAMAQQMTKQGGRK